jgi:hypothetical protein
MSSPFACFSLIIYKQDIITKNVKIYFTLTESWASSVSVVTGRGLDNLDD